MGMAPSIDDSRFANDILINRIGEETLSKVEMKVGIQRKKNQQARD